MAEAAGEGRDDQLPLRGDLRQHQVSGCVSGQPDEQQAVPSQSGGPGRGGYSEDERRKAVAEEERADAAESSFGNHARQEHSRHGKADTHHQGDGDDWAGPVSEHQAVRPRRFVWASVVVAFCDHHGEDTVPHRQDGGQSEENVEARVVFAGDGKDQVAQLRAQHHPDESAAAKVADHFGTTCSRYLILNVQDCRC